MGVTGQHSVIGLMFGVTMCEMGCSAPPLVHLGGPVMYQSHLTVMAISDKL